MASNRASSLTPNSGLSSQSRCTSFLSTEEAEFYKSDNGIMKINSFLEECNTLFHNCSHYRSRENFLKGAVMFVTLK